MNEKKMEKATYVRDDLVRTDFVRPSLSPGNVNEISTVIYEKDDLSTGSGNTFEFETDCAEKIKELLRVQRPLSDEMHERYCLTKAITNSCKVITENTFICDGLEIDMLESEYCITDEDKVHVNVGSIGPIKRSRRLLSMMLFRDFRTLLVFLQILLYQNKHVVQRVLRDFDSYTRKNNRKPLKCTICQLESRVDMSLIIDDLLSDDEDWLEFYNKVSQAECVGPNRDFWRELVNKVNTNGSHRHVSDIISKALSGCRFHSDIVKMLSTDKQHNRNSLVCSCYEIIFQHRKPTGSGSRYSQNMLEQHLSNNDKSKSLIQKKVARHEQRSKTGTQKSTREISTSNYNGCEPSKEDRDVAADICLSSMTQNKNETLSPEKDANKSDNEETVPKTIATEFSPSINSQTEMNEWSVEQLILAGLNDELVSHAENVNKMAFLKNDIPGGEIGRDRYPLSMETANYHSPCRNTGEADTSQHDLDVGLKTNAPKDGDLDQKMAFLKIGIWEYENDNDDGIAPFQLVKKSEGSGKSTNSITKTETVPKLTLNNDQFSPYNIINVQTQEDSEIPGEMLIGNSDEPQSLENDDIDMPIISNMFRETCHSFGRSISDFDNHSTESLKTVGSNNEDNDKRYDHKMLLLKVSEYEDDQESGFSSYQSAQSSESSDSAIGRNNDYEESNTFSLNGQTDNCCVSSDRNCQPEPCNQNKRRGQNELFTKHKSVKGAWERFHQNHCNESNTSSEVLDFLLVVAIFLCLLCCIVQNILFYLGV